MKLPPNRPQTSSSSAPPNGSTPTPPSNIPKHLRKAAGSKKPDVLPAFLQDHPSLSLDDLSETFYDGRSALHMAAWTGAISNVSLLLDMGCDIDKISTGNHNYGKSPIFFAATRSREDVMNLLLDRGANVLICNNKGQSVYSIACSHFGPELIERIKEIEIEQEDRSKPLNGWVDYKKTHPDGNVYGDLDLRFLGRPLSESDVVKDGVVNPTTKETRKGNFPRNNPHAYSSRKWQSAKAGKKKQTQPVTISEEETVEQEKHWEQVQESLQKSDAWTLFSSLLSIVQFLEGKKIQSSWVVESASRLQFLVRLEQALGRLAFEDATKTFSEAIIFCGSGDRHATLVKRMLTKATCGQDDNTAMESKSSVRTLSEQEKEQEAQFWKDAEVASRSNDSKTAFVSLIKVVVFWDAKGCSWLNDCTTRLHDILESESVINDITVKDLVSHCEDIDNRHTSLLRKMVTKTLSNDSENNEAADEASKEGKEIRPPRKTKRKERTLPDHYHSIIKLLKEESGGGFIGPSWSVLMNDTSTPNGSKYLSLPCPPKWVDSPSDLECLRSKLHDTINKQGRELGDEPKLDKFISFDSEFRSEDGTTELATIQFSVLEDGAPLAWVVDLHPDPCDVTFSAMTFLRWLFLESDAHLLGFAHKHDIHMISNYIGEEIPVLSTRFWDLQLLAANKMAEDVGDSRVITSLPGLKSCCSYFLEASGRRNRVQKNDNMQTDWTSWELSKIEQRSDWARRPLTANQLEYAGLDAAVLLVLLAQMYS